MEASIAAIASADKDAQAAGVEASSASVLSWLASGEQTHWLMIFDGADGGYEEVEAFIPAGKQGNILISTRNSGMRRLASSFDTFIKVVELDQDAATALFIKSAGLNESDPSDLAHIADIVRELSYLPLAVDQAAASVASGFCRVDEYLHTYKRHRLRLMDNPAFKGASNYGRAVYTTWDISFAELERRADVKVADSTSYEAAILLLKLFSFFHFDGIREETFCRAAMTQGEWLPPLALNSPLLLHLQETEDNEWDFFNFRQAIRILSMFSLIHYAGSNTYSMHRLVHQWVRDRLPKSDCAEVALLAADVIARSEDPHARTAEDFAHRRALLTHLITLIAHLKQNDLMHQLSADSLWRMARIYRNGGKPADAEALLRQAVSLVRKTNSDVTEQYVSIMAHLAATLDDSKKLREAEAIKWYVLEWHEKYRGTDHPSTRCAKRSLALTLYKLGQYSAAKEIQVQVVDWQKEHLGMDNRDTYVTICHLAVTLHQLGELAEAKDLEMQVLEWRKAHLGMDHPDTYWIMGNLASTLHHIGELVGARGLAMQVVKWRKEHLGLKHKYTLHAMINLACTLEELGEISKAERLRAQVAELQGDSDSSS
jgi:tetratricopeptide (TPR) repeat protein